MAGGAAAVAALLHLMPTAAWALGAALLPVGLGLGLCFPLTTIVAQRRAPPAQLGAASALPTMLRSLGGAVAVALLGEWLRRRLAAAGIASGADAARAMAVGTSGVFLWLSGAAGLALPLAWRLGVASSSTAAPAASIPGQAAAPG